MEGTWTECLYMISIYDPESGSICTCPCNSEQEVFEAFTDIIKHFNDFADYEDYVDQFDDVSRYVEDDMREEKDYLYNLIKSGEIITDIDTIKRIFEIASWNTLGGIGFSVIDSWGRVWFSYGCRGISEG